MYLAVAVTILLSLKDVANYIIAINVKHPLLAIAHVYLLWNWDKLNCFTD